MNIKIRYQDGIVSLFAIKEIEDNKTIPLKAKISTIVVSTKNGIEDKLDVTVTKNYIEEVLITLVILIILALLIIFIIREKRVKLKR